jgi:hypothetical protein
LSDRRAEIGADKKLFEGSASIVVPCVLDVALDATSRSYDLYSDNSVPQMYFTIHRACRDDVLDLFWLLVARVFLIVEVVEVHLEWQLIMTSVSI